MIDIEMTLSIVTLLLVAFHAGSTIAVVRMLARRQDKLEERADAQEKDIWKMRVEHARN